jgi:L,D-peptidoglycan transpeptidase YkuD (ErfK/YbiS/YcfS/YnhG family)
MSEAVGVTRGIVRPREGGAPHQAWLEVGGERVEAVIGPRGLVRHKSEGDGGTPVGVMPIRRVLHRADRVMPACAVPREAIAPEDGWCDAAGDEMYNRMVQLPYGASAERLWRENGAYDVACVLGWNDAPVKSGEGSAIFLHVAPDGGGPTAGCIGVGRAELLRLLAAGLTEIETREA